MRERMEQLGGIFLLHSSPGSGTAVVARLPLSGRRLQEEPEQDAVMSKPEIIRVLVADDHPVVCYGLSAIISAQSDMKVVAQAADGREAVELFRKHQPDVVLMDLRDAHWDGVET